MKLFQKDPIADNILDNIQAGDEVAFKGDTMVHAWSEEKAIEYLKTLHQKMDL